MRRFGSNTAIHKAYDQIEKLLRREGWSLSRFPEMDQISLEFNDEDLEQLQRESTLGQEQYNLLNINQKQVVDHVLQVALNDDTKLSKLIYLGGPGGSGKTFTYKTIYYLIKSNGEIVSTMSFTGIAATLLPNGLTVHKTLDLPVPLYSDSSSSIKMQTKEADYLKSVDIFIWDEAPMAPRYALEIMDRLLQEIMQNNLPFGGKIVVFGGDFRQLLLVLQGGTRSETINISIKFSD